MFGIYAMLERSLEDSFLSTRNKKTIKKIILPTAKVALTMQFELVVII